jgi:hypothetical protein
MGLLEDLSSGKYNLVLIGILFVFMFHQYWGASQTKFEPQGKAGTSCASQTLFEPQGKASASFNKVKSLMVLKEPSDTRSTKEPMADVSNDIKEAVKQVYLADVEAIRNLSEVANKLQAGGYTVAGDLTVKGTIKNQSLDSLNSKIDSINSSLNSSINIINSKIDSIDSKVNSNKTTYDNFINNIAIRKDKQYVIANSGSNLWVNATLSNRPNWNGSSGLFKIEDM